MDALTRRRAGLVILLLLVSLVFVLFKIRIITDLMLFLPEPSNKVERLLHHQLDNGVSTDLVFVALSGLPAEQLAAANNAFVDRLNQSALFRKVVNHSAALTPDALQFVVDNRYLLSHRDLTEQFSVEGFKHALDQRIRGLGSPGGQLEKRFLRSDPGGEVLALLDEWQGKLSKHSRPEALHGVWFSKDHSRTLILAEMQDGTTTLDRERAAIAAVDDAFESIRSPGLEMIVTGPAAFAVESERDIRSDLQFLTALAVTLVALFLWLAYRSVGMLLLIFAPLLAGIVAATALILLLFGEIHGVTLAFGITLAGVAVDYPIHMLTGLTRKPGKDIGYVSKIWPTLRLGVLSTVIAYAAFLLSGFSGLQQLGLFTIVGLGTAALFSRWCLPLLVRGKSDRRQGLHGLHDFLTRIAGAVQGMRPFVPLAGAACVLFLLFTNMPLLHLDVDSLSPVKEDRRVAGKTLRDDLGYWYGGRMLILTAGNKETVLQRSEQLAPALDKLIADGDMDGYDMTAHFLPSKRHQDTNLKAFSDPDAVKNNLLTAMQDSGFRNGVFDPFLNDVKDMASTSPIGLDDIDNEDVGRRLQSLLFDFEEGAAGVILLHGVVDESSLTEMASDQEGLIYMHLKTAATNLVAHSVDRVSKVMVGCIALIYLVLWYAFRSPWRPLKIMVPTFTAAAMTATILVTFNNPLSIFHLISLMLVIGLGLDYALFFNRLPGNSDEWNTTFKSLWICGTTTILVFGILVLSQAPPLQAIGMTVAPGAALSILFAAMWATTAEKNTTRTG